MVDTAPTRQQPPRNDNFLDMSSEFDRNVYKVMRENGDACRHTKCYCAYAHRDGVWCRKCGHLEGRVG
jgi:hypothetical protein